MLALFGEGDQVVQEAPPVAFGPYTLETVEVQEDHVRCARARREVGGIPGKERMYRPCRLRLLSLADEEIGRDLRDRFLEEARLVAGLSHPGIIAIHDYGVRGDTLFLEEDRVDGVDLRRLLDVHGPLDAGLALTVALRLAEVLEYLHGVRDEGGHSRRLVHRNLRPRHVHVTLQGETKLAGFGMARFRGRMLDTAISTVRRRMDYVSPEERRGEGPDIRSDLFCLGILLYEMVTGDTPYQRMSDQALDEYVEDGVFVMPALPALDSDPDGRMAHFLSWLLADDPERRPFRAVDVWQWCWNHRRILGQGDEQARLRSLSAGGG